MNSMLYRITDSSDYIKQLKELDKSRKKLFLLYGISKATAMQLQRRQRKEIFEIFPESLR